MGLLLMTSFSTFRTLPVEPHDGRVGDFSLVGKPVWKHRHTTTSTRKFCARHVLIPLFFLFFSEGGFPKSIQVGIFCSLHFSEFFRFSRIKDIHLQFFFLVRLTKIPLPSFEFSFFFFLFHSHPHVTATWSFADVKHALIRIFDASSKIPVNPVTHNRDPWKIFAE